MLPAIDRAALPATHLDNVYCNATRRIVPQADVADKLLRSRPGDFQHRRFPAPQIFSTADFQHRRFPAPQISPRSPRFRDRDNEPCAPPKHRKRKNPLSLADSGLRKVERRGVEPPTSALRTQRSPN
jgi:hypothetical protein